MIGSKRIAFLVFLTIMVSSFMTVAAAADLEYPNATLSTLAFGSCHAAHKVHRYEENIWEAIRAESPDVFIWTGDAVYPRQRKIANTTYLKQLMDDMRSNETLGYRPFKPPHGTFGTWDDHDFGGNDVGVEMPDKFARKQLFLEFLDLDSQIPDSMQTREGLYYSVTFGIPPQQVKLIFLDTRWHRSKHCFPSLATYVPLGAGLSAFTRWMLAGFNVPRWWPLWDCWKEPTVLGEDQWNWLDLELKDSQANIHIVVSSIQVMTTNPTVESWGLFPLERQRLLTLLGQGISGLFLLSGDVHHADVFSSTATATTATRKSSFLEVTSSGLTHYCSQPFYGRMCEPLLKHYNRNRFVSQVGNEQVDNDHKGNENYYIGRNYGRLDIDWQAQTAEIRVKNEHGQTVLQTGAQKFQQDALTPEEVEQIAPVVDGHMIRSFGSVVAAVAVVVVMGVAMAKKRN